MNKTESFKKLNKHLNLKVNVKKKNLHSKLDKKRENDLEIPELTKQFKDLKTV